MSVSLALSPQVEGLHYVWDVRPACRQICGLTCILQQQSPTCLLISNRLPDPFGWKPDSRLPALDSNGPSRMRGVLPNSLGQIDRQKINYNEQISN